MLCNMLRHIDANSHQTVCEKRKSEQNNCGTRIELIKLHSFYFERFPSLAHYTSLSLSLTLFLSFLQPLGLLLSSSPHLSSFHQSLFYFLYFLFANAVIFTPIIRFLLFSDASSHPFELLCLSVRRSIQSSVSSVSPSVGDAFVKKRGNRCSLAN